MSNITNKINACGFSINDFSSEMLTGFEMLEEAGITITDNLINPKIEQRGFFGTLCLLIRDGDKNLESVLPYLRPGMRFRHCKLIELALTHNDTELLKKYDKIFLNDDLDYKKKFLLADMVRVGADISGLISDNIDNIRLASNTATKGKFFLKA